MLVIPAIDIKERKCVRLREGRMDTATVFSEDSVAMAARWVEAGARRTPIVPPDGAIAGEPQNACLVRYLVQAHSALPGQGVRRLPAGETVTRVPAMAGAGYVALLRGINVCGRNVVRMADLRAAFEDAGYGAVGTYIQSGNVLFESATPSASLESDIERVLADKYGLPLVVLVRSHRQYREVVDRAPSGFGTAPDIYHSDVIFLKAPLSSREAMRAVDPRDGVDQVWPGEGVLYFSRLSKRLSQSRMGRIAGSPVYQSMTIRNWRTTTKLLSLLDQRVEQA